MIPHITHQTWISDTEEVPPVYRQHWIDSWRIHHPDWIYKLWTASSITELARRQYPSLLPVFECPATPGVVKSDIGRLLVLHVFGGVYSDLDSQCLKNLEPLLIDRRFVAGAMDGDYDYVGNSFLASCPRHPLLCTAMEQSFSNWTCSRAQTIEAIAGPDAFGPLAKQAEDVHIAPPLLLYPLSWMRGQSIHAGTLREDVLERAEEYFPESYVVTFYTHNW